MPSLIWYDCRQYRSRCDGLIGRKPCSLLYPSPCQGFCHRTGTIRFVCSRTARAYMQLHQATADCSWLVLKSVEHTFYGFTQQRFSNSLHASLSNIGIFLLPHGIRHANMYTKNVNGWPIMVKSTAPHQHEISEIARCKNRFPWSWNRERRIFRLVWKHLHWFYLLPAHSFANPRCYLEKLICIDGANARRSFIYKSSNECSSQYTSILRHVEQDDGATSTEKPT